MFIPYKVEVAHRSLEVILGKDLEDLSLWFIEPNKLLDGANDCFSFVFD